MPVSASIEDPNLRRLLRAPRIRAADIGSDARAYCPHPCMLPTMDETNTDTTRATRAVDEHRRWLIGLGISVAFGTFGAVMAWLSYSARTRPTPTSTPSVQVAKPVSGEPDHSGWPARHRKGSEHR